MESPTTSIYRVLSEYQTGRKWEKQELFQELHRWAAIFAVEFKLEVPDIAICVDHLGRSRLGHFRAGPNGFGLSSEIAINEFHLPQREFWEVLGTLLHEQLHAWQQVCGKPGRHNYHNKEFRAKAESLGLIVDARGITCYRTPSAFTELLKRQGITVPELPAPALRRLRGMSKLKKWSCGCTNVRVAVSDFRARCLNCGNEFRRIDW